MASAPFSTPASAQQPDLRAYIIYDQLPAGCIPHIVTERSIPMLDVGETVVVDPNDATIDTGDLFVIESGRNSPSGPRRSVVEFRIKDFCIKHDDGEYRDAPCWYALFWSEMSAVDASSRQSIRFMDGPISAENISYLQERTVGRVVGILQPSFAEPKRLRLED